MYVFFEESLLKSFDHFLKIKLFLFYFFIFLLLSIRIFFQKILFIFRQRKGGREKKRERMCGCLSRTPYWETWPATQACILHWELNQWPLDSHSSAQSTKPHQLGCIKNFLCILNVNPLSDIYITNIFSFCMFPFQCYSIFLFCCAELFSLIQSYLYLLLLPVLDVIPKIKIKINTLLRPMSWSFAAKLLCFCLFYELYNFRYCVQFLNPFWGNFPT